MDHTSGLSRLEQMKFVLSEHDPLRKGLSRKAIAEKIVVHFPEAGDLKSVASTVNNYLSTYKDVEFRHLSHSSWALMSSSENSSFPLTMSGDVGHSSINPSNLFVQDSQASLSSQSSWGHPPDSAHPQSQFQPHPPPIFDWSDPQAHRAETTSASSNLTTSHTSPSSSYTPAFGSLLGREATISVGSGTWPNASLQSTTSPYYNAISSLSTSSISAADAPTSAINMPPSNEVRRLAAPDLFGSATARGSSYGVFNGSSAILLSSSSRDFDPFMAGSGQTIDDPTAHVNRDSPPPGFCTTCSRPCVHCIGDYGSSTDLRGQPEVRPF